MAIDTKQIDGLSESGDTASILRQILAGCTKDIVSIDPLPADIYQIDTKTSTEIVSSSLKIKSIYFNVVEDDICITLHLTDGTTRKIPAQVYVSITNGNYCDKLTIGKSSTTTSTQYAKKDSEAETYNRTLQWYVAPASIPNGITNTYSLPLSGTTKYHLYAKLVNS